MFKTIRTAVLFTVLTPFLFMFSSCNDFDITEQLHGTRADIMSMLQSEDIAQRISIDVSNFNFTSQNGTLITADPNSFIFEESGILVTGMIDFELTELFTKSDILQYGIETQSNNTIIESDGEFLFSASQNGQALRLKFDKVLYLTVPNSDPNPGMQLFSGAEGSWWPIGDSLNIFTANDLATFSGYDFSVRRLDWVNIDYFTKFDLPLTDISICLPDGYQDNSISLWIVFRDIDVVLDSSGQNLPIGEVVSIVCIAAQDEDTFRIDIQEVTVEEGLKVNLDPQIESEENIKLMLKTLD